MSEMKKHHNWGGFVSIFAATVFLSFFVIMAMYSFSIHDDTSGVAFLMTAGIFFAYIPDIYTDAVYPVSEKNHCQKRLSYPSGTKSRRSAGD